MWQLPTMTTENILMYLRKSRTDDPMLTVDEVLSKHEQMLEDWTARNFPGQTVPQGNRYREVVSGETIEARPQVQAVLRRAESPAIKAVLIVEPQRLSRGDLEDIGRIVKLLRYSRTIVCTLQYSYDLTDERDRDLFERELKRGNEYLEYQKRIMGNGRLLAVQNGNYLGCVAPDGYRKVCYREGRKKINTLEIVPERAEIIRRIFRSTAAGKSALQIVRELDAEGIPSARGGKWRIPSIRSILDNEHYIGNVTWLRRKEQRTVEGGDVLLTRPRNKEYLSFPGRHEAIIDRELWDEVHTVRLSHLPIKEKARHVNPLAGLVYCQCGSVMVMRTYTREGVQRSAPRLLCENQTNCGTPSCLVSEMQDAVVTALSGAIADFDLQINRTAEEENNDHAQTLARLEKHLADLDRQELSQWEKYTQEAMPKAVFEKLNEKLLRDREATQAQLEDLRQQTTARIDYVKKRASFVSAQQALLDPNRAVREQNLLLKQCVRRITYTRQPSPRQKPRKATNPNPLELEIDLRV